MKLKNNNHSRKNSENLLVITEPSHDLKWMFQKSYNESKWSSPLEILDSALKTCSITIECRDERNEIFVETLFEVVWDITRLFFQNSRCPIYQKMAQNVFVFNVFFFFFSQRLFEWSCFVDYWLAPCRSWDSPFLHRNIFMRSVFILGFWKLKRYGSRAELMAKKNVVTWTNFLTLSFKSLLSNVSTK